MVGHHASRSSQRRQRETIRKAEKPDCSPAAPCAAKSRPRQQLTVGLDCGLASDLRGPDYLVNTHISGHLARTLTSRDLLLALAAVLHNADDRVMGSNPMRIMLVLLFLCLFCCCYFLLFYFLKRYFPASSDRLLSRAKSATGPVAGIAQPIFIRLTDTSLEALLLFVDQQGWQCSSLHG